MQSASSAGRYFQDELHFLVTLRSFVADRVEVSRERGATAEYGCSSPSSPPSSRRSAAASTLPFDAVNTAI